MTILVTGGAGFIGSHLILQVMTGNDTPAIYQLARPGDIRHSILANTLAKQVLAWQPAYTLEEGLSETVKRWNVSN